MVEWKPRAGLSFFVCTTLAACAPTPPATGRSPTPLCVVGAPPNTGGLRIDCTLAGSLPNTRFDPFVGGSACGVNSFTIAAQRLSTPLTLIWAQNGDENDARVRIGGTIGPGTHVGDVGKDSPGDCSTTLGPRVAITTAFHGQYVALVDKQQRPMCVFESRLAFDTFSQTIAVGLAVDVSSLTRERTQDTVLGRVDLEIATGVNRLLNPAALPFSSAFKRRNGRCASDWQPFTE